MCADVLDEAAPQYQLLSWQKKNDLSKVGHLLKPYAGGFDTEQEAALAYDVACVRFRGQVAHTNFDIDGYTYELEHLSEVLSRPLALTCLANPVSAPR